MQIFWLLLSFGFSFSILAAPTQVIIVPNAEVDYGGELTQQGLERAGALADYLILTPNFTQNGLPGVIFASRPSNAPSDNTQACMQTAAPTAEQLSLPIHSGYSKNQSANLASLILNDPFYNGKTVLIFWRTDEIQTLASALGVSSPPNFPSNSYNSAWVVDFSSSASLTVFPQDLLAGDTVTSSGCGTVPYPSNTGILAPSPIIDSSQVWSFVSAPNLHPMKVEINRFDAGTSSGFIFLAPYGFSADPTYGQQGSLIVDNDGNPIWFKPSQSSNLMNTDFRVQTLNGEQVLTFWQGTLVTPPSYTNAPGGSSEPLSCYYILDSTYATIKTVAAQNGFTSDIHEFLLTPSNTALFLSTQIIPMDLTPYGGPQNGYIQDFAIQEVDLATNELLFFWDALDHIPLSDSYEPIANASNTGNIWDVYHLNSVGLTDSPDDILISSRSTWTIYRIHKPTSAILWQLGGKDSSFTIAAGGEFSWQHDARYLPTNVVSLFDDNSDGSSTSEPPSHGLMLQLDLGTMSASIYRTYYHDPNLSVASQGNVQTLSNTNRFIGWGQSQYYSEYAESGNTEPNPSLNLLYDASMPDNNYTYRAYRSDWVAEPYYPPCIAVQTVSGQTTVYASWNGSTETSSWQVFTGSDPTQLTLAASAVKNGFETSISVSTSALYFQVKALDSTNTVIGVSQVTPQGGCSCGCN